MGAATSLAGDPAAPADERAGVPFANTIPRQHGAWSVLLIGFALGAAATGAFTLGTLLLLVTLLAAMPARHTASLYLRLPPSDRRRDGYLTWSWRYAAIATACLTALLALQQAWLLLPFLALALLTGLTQTLLERARLDRTLWGELVGMVGLSLSAPAAAVVSGAAPATALGLWILSALMFCGGVFHVRHEARGARVPTGGTLAASIAYHVATVTLSLALGLVGWMPAAAFLALVPATLRATWPALRPRTGQVNIRRLGFAELAHGLLFLAIATIVYRAQS